MQTSYRTQEQVLLLVSSGANFTPQATTLNGLNLLPTLNQFSSGGGERLRSLRSGLAASPTER